MHPTQKILVVEDDTALKTALFRGLDRAGYQVITASSTAEAEALVSSQNKIDLSIIDMRLPDGDGILLMEKLKILQPQMQTIILTGFATIESAVEATRKGAFHFMTKPFNLEELVGLVNKSLNHHKLEKENRRLKSALHSKYSFQNLVGHSEPFKKVIELAGRVADSDTTILITGESGTGKELIAKAIHYNSPRSENSFVPINCGAIPAELLESELFGHIKGAFTGAIANRAGRFELAHGGTLFLDEIGDMAPSLQVKLLRVIQEKRFEPIGSTKTIESDVRIIAATNANLENAVSEGRFREDLYYRLNVIPVHVPSLRDRPTDIPVLLEHFVSHFNQKRNRHISGFQPAAMELLLNYKWPGNIRELENLVERIAILRGTGHVDVSDLPEHYQIKSTKSLDPARVAIPDNGMDFNSAVDAYENALIVKALEKTGWNRNQAAMLLKLNRTTLVEKIKKKGLQPEA